MVWCPYDLPMYNCMPLQHGSILMILHRALRWQQQNLNQTLNSQETPSTSPSCMSYGASVVRILEKINQVIRPLHCMCNSTGKSRPYIDGLVQERHDFSALAVELHLSCTNPSECLCQVSLTHMLYISESSLLVVYKAYLAHALSNSMNNPWEVIPPTPLTYLPLVPHIYVGE